MMSTPYTKSPWTSVWNGFSFEIVVPWPHETETNHLSPNIATVPTISNIDGYTIDIAQANAAVIAAAPDLLEALEAVKAWDISNNSLDIPIKVRRLMQSAIAKAKGQPCPT